MKFLSVNSRRSKVQGGEARQPGLLALAPSRFGDRQGVALVITLIMLSLITFMAVTFLVLSQRERSSVTGATDQKIARDATDTAFARVCAELLTHMMVDTNFQDYGMQVSTNYINYLGYQPSILSPTNVNYDYLVGAPATGPQSNPQYWENNIADLLYNPRPPVFVVTNVGTGQGEFRFYLDLNRNGRYDTNGLWPVLTGIPGLPYYNATNADLLEPLSYVGTGPIASNNFVGDPEWIGVLEHPDQMHSADNRFLYRYAYLVVPVGQTLDINTMHNQAVTGTLTPGNDGYRRNEGVGPWEMNLAAFLTDLNTNAWPGPVYPGYNPLGAYYYGRPLGSPPLGIPNTGYAFQDALSILSYRYNGNYGNLQSASQLFTNGATALTVDNIDEYSTGSVMTNTTLPTEIGVNTDPVTKPWAGADNPNHVFSQQDIFNIVSGNPSIAQKFYNVGSSNDSYNEYTFYRMLAQMGTDSQPDRGKININYKNTDNSGNVIPGMETNLAPWTALDFFTNAAQAMFRQMNLRDFNGNLVTVTNIPIYQDPNFYYGGTNFNRNYYTPAVHRILQLAANIFDATQTNRYIGGGPTNYPTVFRPVFTSQNHQVWISGYQEVIDTTPALNFQYWDPATAAAKPGPLLGINIYGVPWVIGARKGFPNFNELSMENPLTVSRKLEFTNSQPQNLSIPWTTNQVFDFSITNAFGIEAWNSYTNAYGRPLQLICSNTMSIVVSNENGSPLLNVSNLTFATGGTINSWGPWSADSRTLTRPGVDNSFVIPMLVTNQFTNGIYRMISPPVIPLDPAVWGATFVPHLFMVLHMRLQFMLIDTTANRVIDFVNIDSTQPTVDVASILQGTANGTTPSSTLDEEWDTNMTHGISDGILNQIQVGMGNGVPPDWKDSPTFIQQQTKTFRLRLMRNQRDTNYFEAPYTPNRTIHQLISWQANDPLVHYTAPDLTSTAGTQAKYNTVTLSPSGNWYDNIGNVNFAYQPWGGWHTPGQMSQNGTTNDYDYRLKDPGQQQSDNWDFPTNKLPNVGWLGRIHRGTPWQTVDMKPSQISVQNWMAWDNDNVFITNGAPGGNGTLFDAPFTHPTMDYGLFDLFTTAVNDNAATGRLDVNQTNLAAWSAVLSGVNVMMNTPNGPVWTNIPPAGVYDATNPAGVAAIVQGINATRANTNFANGALMVFRNHLFQRAGDVLSAPQLSVNSPFINTNVFMGPPGAGLFPVSGGGVNDEMVERIPQQVMSLLTLNPNPRFVIYSFGQTLHPADHSLVMGGSFNGLCTNYQITAESATRAVVRVDGTADPQYATKPDSLGRTYPPHIVVEQFNVLGPD